MLAFSSETSGAFVTDTVTSNHDKGSMFSEVPPRKKNKQRSYLKSNTVLDNKNSDELYHKLLLLLLFIISLIFLKTHNLLLLLLYLISQDVKKCNITIYY